MYLHGFHRFEWFCMDLQGFHAFQWIFSLSLSNYKWFQYQLCGLNYKIVPIGNNTIVQGFMHNIEIFELISIDIFIERSQRCVGSEEIATFVANMIRFNLQYFIIIVWCTIYKAVRMKGTSTPLIIPIIMTSNIWNLLRSCIKFSYSIRIVWNCINITIFTDNTIYILIRSGERLYVP